MLCMGQKLAKSNSMGTFAPWATNKYCSDKKASCLVV